MAKVLKFPGAHSPSHDSGDDHAADFSEHTDDARAKPQSKAVLAATYFYKTVKFLLFMVMYWLRLPIVAICGILSFVCFLGFLFAWYAFPETAMVKAFGWTSFVSFVFMWTYDFVLFRMADSDPALLNRH